MGDVHVLPGIRGGTRKYYIRGYIWHADSRYRANMIGDRPSAYLCIYRTGRHRCRAALRVSVGNAGEFVYEALGQHNHLPPVVNPLRMQAALQTLRTLAANYNLTPAQIHQRLIAMYPDLEVYFVRATIEASVRRIRIRARPQVPRNFAQLPNLARVFQDAQDAYLGSVVAEDLVAVIYGRQGMLDLLGYVGELGVETTFHGLPAIPGGEPLLLTVYVAKGGVGFPIITAICQQRSAALYEAVLRFLVERIPGINNIETIACDFERRVISAVRRVFPLVRVVYNWSQLIRAAQRAWVRCFQGQNLDQVPQNALFMAWALPLLPPEQIPLGVVRIIRRLRIDERAHPELQHFRNFIMLWEMMPELISVHGRERRLTNLSEHFIFTLLIRGGRQPNILRFIEMLCRNLRAMETSWGSVLANPAGIEFLQPVFYTADRRHLQCLLDRLERERITIYDFLNSAIPLRRRRRLEFQVQELGAVQNIDDDDLPQLIHLQDPENAPPEEPRQRMVIPPLRRGRRAQEHPDVQPEGAVPEPPANNENQDVGPPRALVGGPQECVVCQTTRSVLAYVPCGHLCLCEPCKNQNQEHNDRCMLCREQAAEIVKVIYTDDPNDVPRRGLVQEMDANLVRRFDDDEEVGPGTGICVLCSNNRPRMAVIECGHFCMCLQCNYRKTQEDRQTRLAQPNSRPQCPICGENYVIAFRLF